MTSEQKVVIITGASRGIGAELVKSYRKSGYQIVATARSIVDGHDPSIVAIDGDIGRPETAERVVSQAVARFGRIDTLVNNAGVFIAKPFIEYSAADFANMVSVNLSGFFHVTRMVAARMLDAGSGHIVNITATIAEQPMTVLPSALATMTKGGLNAITRSLAIEYASRNVRINAVSPGVIDTPMHAPETHGFLTGLHPMGRMGETRDVVEAVMYLENAAFVTGEILHVDGGASAGRW